MKKNTDKTAPPKPRMHDMTLKGASQPMPNAGGSHVLENGKLKEVEPATKNPVPYEDESEDEQQQPGGDAAPGK